MLSPFYPSKLYTTKLSGSSTTTTKSIFATQSLSDTLLSTTEISGGSGGTSTSTPTLDSTTVSLNAGFSAGPVTKTWTHTVTGSNPIIILTAAIFQDVAGTGSITSATWNGGSFTKASSTRTGTKATEIWYLTATTTGSKTMSVTVTGATDDIKLSASSFTNISPYSPLDTKASSNGSTGNPSVSINTLTQGDLVVSTLNRHSTTDATTSVTSLYKDRTSSILGASSYQIANQPSLYTDTYTGSASQNWSMIAISLKPATTTTPTGTTTTTYIHTDHIGSTQVTTSEVGTIQQTLDYYPYGQTRINSQTGVDQKRKFVGMERDNNTGLDYAKARYYNNTRGGFISTDPSFLEIGDPNRFSQVSGQDMRVALMDPQLQNSYSWARGNPIGNKDPEGNIPAVAIPFILFGIGGALDAGMTYYSDVMMNRVQGNPNPYTDNLSSRAEYGVGATIGGFSMTSLGLGRAGAGIVAGGSSLAQDLAGGRSPDFLKAGIVAGGTFITGTAFKGLVGISPFEKAVTRGLSQNAITQGLRYETSQGVFQSGMTSIALNNYQTRNSNAQQNFNKGSGGGGGLSGILNSLSRALSSFSNLLSSLKKN
jgi:RHS repeat-associated protein